MQTAALLNQPRARQIMDGEGLDGLLGASFENVYYLSNLWCEYLFVLPRPTQVYALVAREDLATPHVVAMVGEAANTSQACQRSAHVALDCRFFLAGSREHPL